MQAMDELSGKLSLSQSASMKQIGFMRDNLDLLQQFLMG